MKPWTAKTILAFLSHHHRTLHEMGVRKLGLFGSYARGDQHPDSDIDFLVTIEEMNFGRWMDIWNFLEDHLQQRVDLVPEKQLRPEIRAEVFREIKYVEEFESIPE